MMYSRVADTDGVYPDPRNIRIRIQPSIKYPEPDSTSGRKKTGSRSRPRKTSEKQPGINLISETGFGSATLILRQLPLNNILT